jgi:hypothetical protein
MILTTRKPGAALLAMRRAAQIHQYNHLVLNLLIYHEVVSARMRYRSFIRATEEKQEIEGATSRTLRIRSYSSSK